MSRYYLANSYISYRNEALKKFRNEKIEDLVKKINIAAKSGIKDSNLHNKILTWNKIVFNIQEVRNFLLSYDESLNSLLPSFKKFFIIFDKTSNEWRFDTGTIEPSIG